MFIRSVSGRWALSAKSVSNRCLKRFWLLIVRQDTVQVLMDNPLIKGFWYECGFNRHVSLIWGNVTGGDDYLYVRPMIVNVSRKSKAVHRSRHVNVGEQKDRAFPMLSEVYNRLVTVEAFLDTEARLFKNECRFHYDQGVVFNDDGVGCGRERHSA